MRITDYWQLREEIKKGDIKNSYLLAGENDFIKEESEEVEMSDYNPKGISHNNNPIEKIIYEQKSELKSVKSELSLPFYEQNQSHKRDEETTTKNFEITGISKIEKIKIDEGGDIKDIKFFNEIEDKYINEDNISEIDKKEK